MSVATSTKPVQQLKLPTHREPYYAGKWQKPATERYADVTAPGSGASLGFSRPPEEPAPSGSSRAGRGG